MPSGSRSTPRDGAGAAREPLRAAYLLPELSEAFRKLSGHGEEAFGNAARDRKNVHHRAKAGKAGMRRGRGSETGKGVEEEAEEEAEERAEDEAVKGRKMRR